MFIQMISRPTLDRGPRARGVAMACRSVYLMFGTIAPRIHDANFGAHRMVEVAPAGSVARTVGVLGKRCRRRVGHDRQLAVEVVEVDKALLCCACLRWRAPVLREVPFHEDEEHRYQQKRENISFHHR